MHNKIDVDKKLIADPEIESSIEQLWDECQSEDDARRLINYMTSHQSEAWRKLMNKTQNHNLKYCYLLEDSSSEIYEMVANAMADADGLVDIPN